MTAWTEARVEALRRRFLAGDSFAVIARSLGEGVSRSACIGKAARLGLERARDPGEFHRIASKMGTRRAQASRDPEQRTLRVRSARLAPAIAFEPPGEGAIRMAAVESWHCRWPLGNPEGPDFRFCGAQRVKGAYCAAHAARAYVAAPADQGVEWLVRIFGRLA